MSVNTELDFLCFMAAQMRRDSVLEDALFQSGANADCATAMAHKSILFVLEQKIERLKSRMN